jgi:hypothetical protein
MTRRQLTGRQRWWCPLVAVAAGAVLAAGCSQQHGPGVASTGSGSPKASASGTAKASALAYSRCMRAHGIKDFPDPDAKGQIQLETHPGSDIDPDNPTFKAADAACKPLLPPAQQPPAHLKEDNLKYARCMRQHGISDFPDPQADGTLQIKAEPGSDLDPNNPRYKTANDACKDLLPAGGDGGVTNENGS